MISCSNYDYFEIACMHRYLIRLTMKTGIVIEGTAIDMKLNDDRDECIEINTNETYTLIELDEIVELEALIDNPHFTLINF